MSTLRVCEYTGEEIRAIARSSEDDPHFCTYITTSAVCQVTRVWGLKRFASIPLRQITGVAYESSSQVVAGVIAAVTFAAAILLSLVAARTRQPSLFYALAGISGVSSFLALLLCLLGRKRTLKVSSPSSSIQVEVKGSIPSDMIELLVKESQLAGSQRPIAGSLQCEPKGETDDS